MLYKHENWPTYHAGITAVAKYTDIPQSKLDEAFIYQIHRRSDIEGDGCLRSHGQHSVISLKYCNIPDQ